MKLQISQIIGLAQNAGFSGDDLAIAAAIALAESGGDPSAYNPEIAAGAPQGQGSFGLWQIYLKAHPEYANANLFDPATNAGAAFAVYSRAGNSFRPWSTFKNNAYLAHLNDVSTTLDAMNAAAPTDTTIASDGGGTDPGSGGDSSGGSPGTGGILAMMTFGAVVLWAVLRAFRG